MIIKIEIPNKLINEIIRLGSKPRGKATEAELEEYFKLMADVGMMVCNKILHK
jgi:hypothetical protein